MKYQFINKFMMIAVALVIAGCQFPKTHWPEMEGLVLEEGSKEPIADAVVVAQWSGHAAGTVGGGTTICFHVAVTKTDESGKYYFPGWDNKGKWKSLSDQNVWVYAYKSGYGLSDSLGRDAVYIPYFSGTEKDKFELLSTVMRRTGCSSSDESVDPTNELRKILYEEVKVLPASITRKKYNGLDWFARMAGVH
jgi:hypothetical protein